MSENSTLAKDLNNLIDDRISSIPYPMKCNITKVYSDGVHADITCDLGELTYVETISNNLTAGHTGILIFLDGSSQEYIVITN